MTTTARTGRPDARQRVVSVALPALVLLVLAAASPCAAQIELSVDAGYFDMTNARNSAKAVFGGSSGGFTVGASGAFGLGTHFFAGAAARHFQRKGERVFVADATGEPFRLGHPLTVRVIPVFAFLGYRLSPGATFSPYVAIGGGITLFHEESTVAGLTDSESQSKPAGHVLGGLEYGRGSLRVGVEGGYSTVPNSIGVGGVSKVYGEKDIGGFSLLARVIYTH